jgi:hypothetical protein
MKGWDEWRTLATCGDVSTPKVKGHRYTGSLSQRGRGKELKAKALARTMPHGLPVDAQRGDLVGGQARLSEEVLDQVCHRIGERQACLGCHLKGVGQSCRQQRCELIPQARGHLMRAARKPADACLMAINEAGIKPIEARASHDTDELQGWDAAVFTLSSRESRLRRSWATT